MKKITPIIKQKRIIEQEVEVCPHCNKEIMEKSTFVDPDNYVYHRPCFEKGPIDKITPPSAEEMKKILGWGK